MFQVKYFIIQINYSFQRDCNQISLLNCGPYTCAMTKTECNDSIKNIIKDIIIGMGKLFLDVISFGLSIII